MGKIHNFESRIKSYTDAYKKFQDRYLSFDKIKKVNTRGIPNGEPLKEVRPLLREILRCGLDCSREVTSLSECKDKHISPL